MLHQHQISFQQLPFQTVFPKGNGCLQFTAVGHKQVLPGWSMVGVNPNPHIPSFDSWCFTFFFLDRFVHFDLIFALAILQSDHGGQCNFVFNLNSSSGPGGDILWKLLALHVTGQYGTYPAKGA